MATYKDIKIDTVIKQFGIKYALEPYAAHQMTVAPDIVED